MNSVDGILLVDKPKGLSSHDVVNNIRRISGTKRVGHTGTLDPNATGLLIIGIGEATKFIPYIREKKKKYCAEIIFGTETDTDDILGKPLIQKDLPTVNLEELTQCINSFIGDLNQVPPRFSAKKVKGKKLYEYALRGEEIEIKPSPIKIYSIKIKDASNYPQSLLIEVECSKGTYIRSLARDIGRKLNSAAHMGELRRECSGPFNISNALTLDALSKNGALKEHLLPIESVLLDLPQVKVNHQSLKYLKNGNKLFPHNLLTDLQNLRPESMVRLYDDEVFYGVGQIKKEKDFFTVQPKRIMNHLEESEEEKNNYNQEPLVLALGFFDGVHQGHQKLISIANESAKDLGISSGVMSFKKHPLTEIFPRYAPKLLMSNDEKRKKILELGTDYVFLEPFTEQLMRLKPEEFVRDFLLKKFNIRKLIVGYNYTFGYKGKGKAEDLKALGEKYGFEVEIVEPITVEDETVSSTVIRELLGAGKVEEVQRLLGHPYRISGKIQEGKKLGRQYKIPTANLDYDEERLLPQNGVYFTRVKIGDEVYDGLTNLGDNPTFSKHPYAIETYIYDFDEDIYGKEVTLEFLKHIREDKKFDSVDELFNQIRSDINKVDRLYRKQENN